MPGAGRTRSLVCQMEKHTSARDQQKWKPVLRSIARKFMRKAHDLFGKPVPTFPDHAQSHRGFGRIHPAFPHANGFNGL